MGSCGGNKGKSVRAHVGDDLVMEILARLPTRSLRRFQCVSTAWRGFISEVSASRTLLHPVSGLLFYSHWHFDGSGPSHVHYAPISDHQNQEEEEEENYFLDFLSLLSSLPFYSDTYVIHSCNGLLLFVTRSCRPHRVVYIVWNPATMEYYALPERRRRRRPFPCFLAFDPCESPHYKVVGFSKSPEGRAIADIYSSMTGKWVERTFPHRKHLRPFHSTSFFHRGALHVVRPPKHLIRFDVEKESFQALSLPEVLGKLGMFEARTCLGESRGHLYYAVISFQRSELKIWMLDEGSPNNWSLKHRISTKVLAKYPLALANEPSNRAYTPIAFHPDSDVVYLGMPGKILAYHPSSGRLEEICTANIGVECWSVFTVIPCLESINPPGGKLIRH